MNKLENRRLGKADSPQKIQQPENETASDILTHDLVAINDFLHFVDAEPFVTPEKAENIKRVAFKKTRSD